MKEIFVKKILNILLVVMLLISTMFGLTACARGGGSSGGSSNGGNSGSSSGGGSSSSGSLGESNQENDGEDAAMEITSDSEDDFFSGVLIMYDAGFSGSFYDEATSSNKIFIELVDRQLVTFTTHLLYALNILYGNNADFTATELDRYNLLDTTISSSRDIDIKEMWGSVSNLEIQSSTILADSLADKNSCVINTDDLDRDKEILAQSLGTVAGFGEDKLGKTNQFNFNNAIKGGYKYIVDESDSNLGSFAEEIDENLLGTDFAWNVDVSGALFSDDICTGIADILSKGTYDGASEKGNYAESIIDIEYLGFSRNDLKNISEYILTEIIGKAYAKDEAIRQTIPTNSSEIVTEEEGKNLFTTNIDSHYYKAYGFVIPILVERMAEMTTAGYYTTSQEYDSLEEESKVRTYLIMPRTNITIMKCSELFDATNDFNVEDMVDPDTGEIDWGSMDSGSLDSETGSANAMATPILENVKIKQIVFLPKLSEEVKAEYRTALEEKYGSEYTKYIDYRFDITSITLGIKGGIVDEESNEPFICLPVFTIKTGKPGEEGEIVYMDKAQNEAFNEDYPIPAFNDANSLFVTYVYDVETDVASFVLSDAMEGNKFSDYNGVAMFDDAGVANSEYFHSTGGNNYLIVNKGASTIEDDETVYLAKYNENGDFVFTFNGGSNFLQIDFNYFKKDSSDIYDDDLSDKILPQVVTLMNLAVWT